MNPAAGATASDIVAHAIMEELRMQTIQISTPDEPNYSSDPYYDAEQKIIEIIEAHWAAEEKLQKRMEAQAARDKRLADKLSFAIEYTRMNTWQRKNIEAVIAELQNHIEEPKS